MHYSFSHKSSILFQISYNNTVSEQPKKKIVLLSNTQHSCNLYLVTIYVPLCIVHIKYKCICWMFNVWEREYEINDKEHAYSNFVDNSTSVQCQISNGKQRNRLKTVMVIISKKNTRKEKRTFLYCLLEYCALCGAFFICELWEHVKFDLCLCFCVLFIRNSFREKEKIAKIESSSLFVKELIR